MNSVQKMNSILRYLPVELCHEFLLYLNVNDIFKSGTIFNLHRNIMGNHYFWRLKSKLDKLQPLKYHQKSENYEIYEKQFQCIEQALYTYLDELRQNWLKKSWNDALKLVEKGPERTVFGHPITISYADEKIIILFTEHNWFEIRNVATNKVISKLKMLKHYCTEMNVEFPFLISYDDYRNEMFVWNIEEQKLLWKRRFPRIMRNNNIFQNRCCTNYNTIAASTNSAFWISLIDMSTGIIKGNLQHDTEIFGSNFCNNLLLIKTHMGNFLNIWDIDNQMLKYSIDISSTRFYRVLNNCDEYAILCSSTHSRYVCYVLSLKNGRILYEFETKFLILSDRPLTKIVLRKSQVIFFDNENNLKVVNYITRQCLLNKKYEVKIRAVAANSNFIILATSCDIRILDAETFNELRIFSLKAAGFWNDAHIKYFMALESKLIFEYLNKPSYDQNVQFMLNFDVNPSNVEDLETR